MSAMQQRFSNFAFIMKVAVKHITLRIFILLMTGVMALLIANSALFLHVHKLADGTINSHAHPYDKTSDSQPYKAHQHSKVEYLLFHNLEILFPVFFLIFFLSAFTTKRKVLFDLIAVRQLVCLNLYKGRAPPVL